MSEVLKKGHDQLLLEIHKATKAMELRPGVNDPSVMVWENPMAVLAEIFGLPETPAVIFNDLKRDFPGVIMIREFPQDGVTWMKVGDYHVGSQTIMNIIFETKFGKLLTFKREGVPYPANFSGSRWYFDSETILDEHEELFGILSPGQINNLESDKARLIEYQFIPHYDRALWRYGEGAARIIYFWDTNENRLSYVAHSCRDRGTETEEEDYYEVADNDRVIVIEPFGMFKLPEKVEVAELLRNLFFPIKVNRLSLDPSAIVLPAQEFLGIQKVD